MRKLLLVIVVLALLAGIALQTGMAQPLVKWRIEAALVESGLPEDQAGCMAGRMADRLSVLQLYNLRSGMAPIDGEAENPTGLADLVRRIRRGGDTETVAVLTTSAGLCAIGIG